MKENPLPCTGLVIAGGAASRMGQNKALLRWRNGNLVQHLVQVILQTVKEIMIVGLDSADLFSDYPVQIVSDDKQNGPLGGILLGLKTMNTDKALVVACDMPFVTESSIKILWEQSENFDVVVPKTPDGLHPLFGIYSKSCIIPIERLLARNNKKIIGFFNEVSCKIFYPETDLESWQK
ncbi:molybdenum cofactor guanylyltransferase, partial [bacterium]|nr:molybdenum cofactor guanylyltransferase [bacterium]